MKKNKKIIRTKQELKWAYAEMYLRNLYDCAALFADENFAKLFNNLMQYVYDRLDNLPCKMTLLTNIWLQNNTNKTVKNKNEE